jgi:putative CocE/NonD family hydrolase
MPEALPLRPRETASMRTRDGVRLDADIWRPAGAGPWPVLLMRQPYGRAIASTVVYAHPAWYAGRGYIVAIQDVRGRGTSEGDFDPFLHELADGEDAVAWAAQLPDASGAVGMYGFSYQGMTQLFAAAGGHPALKTICPAMAACDTFADFAYEGGALRLQIGLSWGLQLGAEAARRAGDAAAHQALFAAGQNLPLHEALPLLPEVLRKYAHYSHYGDWAGHCAPGPYWEARSPRAVLDQVRLPMLHIGGWYDFMRSGTLALYREMARRPAAGPQRLLIGPWGHLPWGPQAGEADHGAAAANRIDQAQLRWFDHWLKGLDNGVEREPPVRLYSLGEGWVDLPAWPEGEGRQSSLYLASGGRAALDPQDGRLADAPAAPGTDMLVFDPWRPTPSLGGHSGFPPGRHDRRAIDERSDVLTYTTAPLAADLRLAGAIGAELHVRADQPAFDLAVTLSEVRPDGRVLNLADGFLRVGAPDAPVTVSLGAICALVGRGTALRLSLAAGAFPAFAVNPGDGSHPARTRLIDRRVIVLELGHGAGQASRVTLTLG